MPSSKTWERIVLPRRANDIRELDLIASIDAIELGARPGADLMLLDRAAIRLTEKIFLHDSDGPRRALLHRGQTDPGFALRLLTNIFPETTRRLEAGWAEDRLSFVDVTIAAARIQDAVRVLGRVELPKADAAAVALIVPPWEQHTLAAVFAAQAMRDLGAYVRIIAGPNIAVITSLIARAPVQALMLSVSGSASRDQTPALISTLRDRVPRALPVVVGGAIAEPGAMAECPLGADLMTNSFEEALGFCKIPLSHPKGEMVHAD